MIEPGKQTAKLAWAEGMEKRNPGNPYISAIKDRLIILRHHLLDVHEDLGNSGNMHLSGECRVYMQHSIGKLFRAAVDCYDHTLKIRRVVKTKLDFTRSPENNLYVTVDGVDKFLTTISPGIVEISDSALAKIAETEENLVEWFYSAIAKPFFALQDTLLGDKKEIWTLNGPKIYSDQIAEICRFKVWDTVLVP
jgi:hypothetical protein